MHPDYTELEVVCPATEKTETLYLEPRPSATPRIVGCSKFAGSKVECCGGCLQFDLEPPRITGR